MLQGLVFVNQKGSGVTDADLATIAAAIHLQIARDFAPDWRSAPLYVRSIGMAGGGGVNPHEVPIYAFANSDQAGALGYHSLTPEGKIYGRVFVDPCVQNGGSILGDDANPSALSFSSCCSHEALEATGDPTVNLWADGPTIAQGSAYAYEACDPVEGDQYFVTVGGACVGVSNYVFREWFLPGNAKPVDKMGTCPGAFQLAPNGYMVVRSSPGTEAQVFAQETSEAMKAYRKAKASPVGRTDLRIAHAVRTFRSEEGSKILMAPGVVERRA